MAWLMGLAWLGLLGFPVLLGVDAGDDVRRAGIAGLALVCGLLVVRLFSGVGRIEPMAGLRVVLRDRPPRRWVAWLGLGVLVAVGVAQTFLELGHRPALAVFTVAAGSAIVLVVIVARWFSVFATLSVVGVAIGVAALVVVESVATGFQHEFERRVLGVYAHINVTRTFGVAEYRRFERYLRTIPGVVGASPFIYYGVALAPWDPEGKRGGDVRTASVLVKGVEPATAGEVIDLQQHLDRVAPGVAITDLRTDLVSEPVLDRGPDELPAVISSTPDPRGESWYAASIDAWNSARLRAADPEDPSRDPWAEVEPTAVDVAALPTCFVGSALARELSIASGDTVLLVDPGAGFDHTQTPAFRRYRVAGIFRAGFLEYDTRLVYVALQELQHFKYRGRDVVSGVDLRLEDPEGAAEVAAVLHRTIGEGEYSILEWQKLNANLFQSIRTQKSVLTVILSLVSAVAGFNVLAALWTMVARRTAEIAILASMGATAGSIARTFQFAGMAIGTAGCAGGLVLGLVLCRVVEVFGYALDPEVYFIESLPVEYDLGQMGVVAGVTLLICFIATLPPALRAAKLRPVEGLRYE